LLKGGHNTPLSDDFDIRFIVANLIIAVEEILEMLGRTLNLQSRQTTLGSPGPFKG
jgi:hypothetical protein